jgi:hypothetical protein
VASEERPTQLDEAKVAHEPAIEAAEPEGDDHAGRPRAEIRLALDARCGGLGRYAVQLLDVPGARDADERGRATCREPVRDEGGRRIAGEIGVARRRVEVAALGRR